MTTLKNILSMLVIILCAYLFITHGNDGRNYKKEKEQLESDAKLLQKQSDSLNMANINLQNQYLKLEEKSVQDSVISDSLRNEYDYIASNVVKSGQKADAFSKKFIDDKKKIYLLENNKNYRSGDDLLLSLSKKIN